MRFYTWMLYRQLGSLEWKSYGDPWPKARLNKRELSEALNKITCRLLLPGQRVRLESGRTCTIVLVAETFVIKLDSEYADPGKDQFEVPASAIVEVLS